LAVPPFFHRLKTVKTVKTVETAAHRIDGAIVFYI